MQKILIFALFTSALFSEEKAAGITLALDVEPVWLLISAALVFFMQAGFLLLETGLVRAKNAINVAVKNLIDFLIAFVMFFIFGYALMFGKSADGFAGTSLFALSGLTSAKEIAFALFQATFLGTAATIVSGAVAERI